MELKYDPRILKQLGTELITSDEIAIVELIKNAYDAQANNVRLHFIDSKHHIDKINWLSPQTDISQEILKELYFPCIVIEDDGIGMETKDIESGFLTVGSTIKQNLKEEQRQGTHSKERMILGEKGLGRLATQRLSSVLHIETFSKISNTGTYFKLNWSDLIQGKKNIINKPLNAKKSYTRLWLNGNSKTFEHLIDTSKFPKNVLYYDEKDIKKLKLHEKLQATISFLYSPFEKDDIRQTDNFNIFVYYNEHLIDSEFHSESIQIAETIHSFKLKESNKELTFEANLTLRPWFIERTHRNAIDKIFYSEKIKEHTYYHKLHNTYKEKYERNLIEIKNESQFISDFISSMKNRKIEITNEQINKLKNILPIEGKIYSFKRDSKLFKIAVDSAKDSEMLTQKISIENIRDFLNFHNGIKLYRGPFRIANLGDKDSDWLHLQQERTRGQQFFRFELGNIIGYVKINDFYQEYIQEITSRQDTEDNLYKLILEQFLHFTINKVFYDFNSRAYNLTMDILRENNLLLTDPLADIKKEKDRIQQLVDNAKESLNNFNQSIKTITSNAELNTPEKIATVQKEISNLQESTNTFNLTINTTVESLKTTEDLLNKAEKSHHDVKADAFNHYKLMANGLVTETLTHELHSMITKKSYTTAHKYLNELRVYLQDNDALDTYKTSLKPLNSIFTEIEGNISNLNRFYKLLEKTFIKKREDDIFENIAIHNFITDLEYQLKQRLNRHKIDFNFPSTINMVWALPKGALLHVLHNLIDNSIYWIDQRRIKAIDSDKDYYSELKDFITIEKYSDNSIRFYDSGTGVIQNMQDRVFHFLESGKTSNGRGMGLFIVKELLNSFGADIKLLEETNKYNNRYIFEITIPEENII